MERRKTGQAAGDTVGSATLGGSATYEYGSCHTLKQARHRLTYLRFCVLPLDIADPTGWCDRHATWARLASSLPRTTGRSGPWSRRTERRRRPRPTTKWDRRTNTRSWSAFGPHSTCVQRYRAVLMTWVRHQRRQPSGRGPAPAALSGPPTPAPPDPVVEVVANRDGPSLRWATATTTRATRSQDQ